MAAAPTLASNATQSQALAYLNAFWGSAVYRNSKSTPYNGKNAAQLYAYIAARNPKAPPYQIAVAVSDLLLSSETASAIGQGVNTATTALGDTATGVETANYGFTLSTLLSDLQNKTLWIRVAKVIGGGALLLIGVAHMTGADNAVAAVARKAPLPV